MKHTVGTGPQTGSEVSSRQWFFLFGLIPMGRQDSQDIAGAATNYRVTTKQGVVDIILNLFTAIVTIQSRTIIVET